MKKTKTLQNNHVTEITPEAPFNFNATIHKPDHFPSADNDWKPGTRWQTMLWQGEPLGLRLDDIGTIEKPCIRLSIWSAKALSQRFVKELITEIIYRYNLTLDLSGFYRQFTTVPGMAPVLNRWYGMRPLNVGSLYEYLIVAIVLQNATVRRSVAMMQAMYDSFGTLLDYDGKQLCCPWQPDGLHNVDEQELRDLKVGYRAKSIRRVTTAFVSGQINEYSLRGKSREQQRDALLDLYGIGPASVGYVLSDVFHHLDEMEHISPWEQKIYSKLFFGTEPDEPMPVEEILSYFDERFEGYRQIAVHYFWEDLFWRRKTGCVPWLDKLIHL